MTRNWQDAAEAWENAKVESEDVLEKARDAIINEMFSNPSQEAKVLYDNNPAIVGQIRALKESLKEQGIDPESAKGKNILLDFTRSAMKSI